MKRRRLITILLSLVMMLTYMPAVAFAADGEQGQDIASGTSGTCDWVIDSDGVLTISGGTMDSWSVDPPWHAYGEMITSVKTNGVVKLYTCINMFEGCRNMTEIEAAFFDTSDVEDMWSMFSWCSSLKDLDLTRFDTSKVTNMYNMFYCCKSLRNLNVSKFDTASATTMSGMFSGCESLTELDVTRFDTSNVTDMEFMFSGCKGLTELDVTRLDTSNVTDMHGMFYGCEGLTALDVSGFDTSNVETMRSMFRWCRGLSSLDVSHFNTAKVKNMEEMFAYCSKLTGLNITGFDTSNVKTMSSMFESCRSLSSIDVSHFDTSAATSISMMFNDCRSLSNIDVSGFDTSKVTSLYGLFYGCEALKSADLTSFNTSNVTDMRRMFEYCANLTSVDLSSFDTSKVTQMNYMFGGDGENSICGNPNDFTLKVGKWTGGATFPMNMEDLSTGKVYAKGAGIPAVTNHTFVSTTKQPGETDPVNPDSPSAPVDPCKAGHTFGAWATTKAASEIAAGSQSRKCSFCGTTETRSIAQLAPTLRAVKISKPKAAKKSATVKWKKISKKNRKKIKKVQIQYSTDKTFRKGVKTKYASAKKTSYKIKGLKSKKTYYVKIRAYTKNSSGVHVSKWSSVKKVKAK